ncbi:MAG: ATP-binding protein [Candidatus Lambdaproteobacteria bacterium]|nr:ATP-binding protein [Candidatus Lambdaproteobacteria bacterium]
MLFVDDEEGIRATFQRRFANKFNIFLAPDGLVAAHLLDSNDQVQIVVTDIRMPNVDGFELIRHARAKNPELGFIVVSGHGDYDDVVRAMRLGARNFFRKPYDFAELEHAIRTEAERYILLQEDRRKQLRERETDTYLVGVDNLTYLIPNDLELASTIAFRLVRVFESMGVCNEDTRQNTALGLMELIINAIEHGNLEMAGDTKIQLKSSSEADYLDEIARRKHALPFQDRVVKIVATVSDSKAVVRIEDEGPGFDVSRIPDPTDPANLFKPSGRGILLAQMFMDELRFSDGGNVVTAVKHKHPPGV